MSQSELQQLQRSLRAILQDQSDPKPLRIPHIRDIESFYKNESEDKKKVLCRYYNNNKCTKGIHCPYSHDKELLRQQRFKIELCKNFEQTGSCKFKDSCTFAHGRAELRYNK